MCATSGESIFSATGKPSCEAIIIASSALRATTVSVTGMWNDDSSAFDSISVSTSRRSASTLSMTSRAPSMSGLASADSGGGVCSSSCWLLWNAAMLPNAPTAASGVRKLGMPASASTPRAAATEVSPIQQASSGLPTPALAATSACATSAASTPAFGACMTSTPSTAASPPAASTAAR